MDDGGETCCDFWKNDSCHQKSFSPEKLRAYFAPAALMCSWNEETILEELFAAGDRQNRIPLRALSSKFRKMGVSTSAVKLSTPRKAKLGRKLSSRLSCFNSTKDTTCGKDSRQATPSAFFANCENSMKLN